MCRQLIEIEINNLDKLYDLHGNDKFAIRYKCVVCGKDVTRNFYSSKIESYKQLKCENCIKTKVDHGPGFSKENPLEITEYQPNIFQQFLNQKRNRVWIKYKCTNCGKEVVTEFISWNYIKDTKLQKDMAKFQCRECNCCDTKSLTRIVTEEEYNNSFKYTDDLYKIIHSPEEMRRLKNEDEKIAYHCSDPNCVYHKDNWFKMKSAKKSRIENYLEFGVLLCEYHHFVRKYPNEQAINTRKETFIKNWGSKHPMQNEEFKRKYFNNLQSIYGKGVMSTLTVSEIKTKSEQTKLAKFGTIYPSQNPNVAKQMSETQINKSPEEKQRILNDRQDTNRKRYGHDWYTETLEFLEAEKQGSLEKYGVENPFFDPIIQAELKSLGIKRIEEKYGTKCYLGSKAYEERLIRETGSTSKTRKYLYYGQVFDSSWELALWIFAIDHNLPIYRCPIIYKFNYNGEMYSCNPDFLYIDRIIEIKGDHFINQDDGKMYLPFRRKEWSDEKYKFMCGIYEAKRQCLLSHNVTLWFKSDIQFALDYIKSNYGKNYLKKFKLQNPTNPSFNVCGNIAFDTSIRRSVFSYPIFSAKGISPYDINKEEKFHFPNKGVSPFDIGLSRISHD